MSRKSLMDMLKAVQEEKNIDYAKKFLADFTHTIEKIDADNSRPPSQTLKPSSLRCLRSGFFQVVGAPLDGVPTSTNLIGICESGTFIHEMVQSKAVKLDGWEYVNVAEYVREKNLNLEILKECDFEKGEYETKLYSNKYNIRFLADGILKYKNKIFILEIKSISGSKFYTTKDVPSHYKTQAISYSKLLGIPSVLFLFVDRDLFNMKTFLYTPTEQERMDWDANLSYVTYCIENNIVPAKQEIAKKDRKFCQYCDYRNVCGSLKDEEPYTR